MSEPGEGPLPGRITIQTTDASGKCRRVSKGQSSTGCITCRGRKVKCIETKPTCIRCQTARFKCEGYTSNFRIVTSNSLVPTARPVASSTRARMPLYYQPLVDEVLYLAQHFTIKPVPTHSSTYEKEARLTLSAASKPAIKHALASLNTLLRVHAEKGSSSAAEQMTNSIQRGIQEYTNALGALATRLADNATATRKAALLCCQMFISIETALNNFTSAIQHFVRGVQIMHEYGWPSLSNPDGIPNVDLFIIKMFLSCPDRLFTFPPESLDKVEMEWKAVDDLGRPNLCQGMLQARQQLASIYLYGRYHLFSSPLSLANESTPLNSRLAALFTILFYLILRFSLDMAFQHLALDTDILKAELDEMAWVASLLTQLKAV
ncbi:hypothetical protein LZL87_012185 [Fusarium oxysporum]|nr:hypothetical protein LZL87_012185 [Fusarium oxysporum]